MDKDFTALYDIKTPSATCDRGWIQRRRLSGTKQELRRPSFGYQLSLPFYNLIHKVPPFSLFIFLVLFNFRICLGKVKRKRSGVVLILYIISQTAYYNVIC